MNTGGAIHNLKNRYNIKKGKLLVIAGDQFYFFPNNEWERAIKKIEKAHSVLFGLKTNGRSESYNELVLDKGLLKSIVPYKTESHFNKDYVTYSGLGLVNMELLENKNGKSSFFETCTFCAFRCSCSHHGQPSQTRTRNPTDNAFSDQGIILNRLPLNQALLITH